MMERYVPQGVFDRRVKLIEEKLKRFGLDSDLLNRLEADNKYYVDQIVDNINSGIISFDSINQQIEDALAAAEDYTDIAISHIPTPTPYSDTEIRTMISNFVSGYNNFASNTLRFNNVFDADGEFTGKIRPTSIETAALFVGTRSQQLALNGIEFRVLPYDTGSGELQVIGSKRSKESTTSSNTIAGFLFHYGFGTNTLPKVYVVYENTLSLTDTSGNTNGFYIYVQLKATKTEYKQVTVTSADFEQKYKSLYVSNNHDRVLLTNYASNRTYYQKNPAYISQSSGSGANNQYISIGTISEDDFKESNLDEIYYLNGSTYTLAKPLYNSSATYYEKQEETNVNNDATSESEATTGAGGSSSSNYIANIIVSQEQIGLNDKLTSDGVLTIKLGYISIATNTSRPIENTNPTQYYKQRKVDMTYGSTTIDGRLITTGRIEGNGAYFDLDQGKIGGKIEFTLDGTSHIGTLEDVFTGATEIAGGMITSNLICLKPEITVIPSYDSSASYGIKNGNNQFQAIEIHTLTDDDDNVYALYPSGLQLYKNNLNTPITISSQPGVISGGLAGIKDYPAFWAGGSKKFAENAVDIRNISSDFTDRYNRYQSALSTIPNVFIDFDGFARLGNTWIMGNDVKYGGLGRAAYKNTPSPETNNASTSEVVLGNDTRLTDSRPANGGNAYTISGSYTYNGGQQNPNYFGTNKVGALMMNTIVNSNNQYKDWIIMDCYSGNDVGGGVAFGVNRQTLGAYIMRSAATRTSWAESAELLGTHNYSSYALPLSGGTVTGTLVLSKTQDAAGNANNSPALIIGGTATSQHIEIDGNEILSKSNGTTPSTLYLQDGSGNVCVAGSGGLRLDNTSGHLYMLYNYSYFPVVKNYNNANVTMNACGGSLHLGYENTTWLDFLNAKAQLDSVGNFYAKGGVTALATLSSDKRLKKNIKPFNAKQIIDKLKPVEFEWNKKANKYNNNLELNKKNYGLIAQDSDNIIDDLVFDLPDNKGYKGVRYEKLIPILLQAIKEQQKEIDELKKKIK